MNGRENFTQGGDAQAIKQIAVAYYGGYTNMFEAHDWPERSEKIIPSVQAHVVETYGSVKAFEDAHKRGDLMFPMEAIKSDPPNVWLTSFYGFHPEEWGYVGFTDEGRRKHFLKNSAPGVLVVIYGAGKANKGDLGVVIGILQCSHEIGHARQFMAPAVWLDKERDPERSRKWNYGVRATRAWRVLGEKRIDVRVFAPHATASGAWQHIGAQGVPLTKREAASILELDLEEVEVYGGSPFFEFRSGGAKEVLAPSKAGPVSQKPFTTAESEGPKHLYILKLIGDADAFVGEAVHGRTVVKAGFSGCPQTRCDDHNRALPSRCAFHWEILHSGGKAGFAPYASSDHAKAGEKAMQAVLRRPPHGESLGGEFFLAPLDLIGEAWEMGNSAAKAYRK